MSDAHRTRTYYRWFASYEVPFRPLDPIGYSATESMSSYYVGEHNPDGRLVAFEKLSVVEEPVVGPVPFDVLPADSSAYYQRLPDGPGSGPSALVAIPYSDTEDMPEFFRRDIDASGEARFVRIRRERVFRDLYTYWPSGKLRSRTMSRDRGEVSHWDFDEEGAMRPVPITSVATEPAAHSLSIRRIGEEFDVRLEGSESAGTSCRIRIQDVLPREVPFDVSTEFNELGNALRDRLLPNSLSWHTIARGGLTVVLDETAASIPWELFLGPSVLCSRKFYGRHDWPAFEQAPPAPRRLRALVIADPAEDADLNIPQAQAEGHAVLATLTGGRNRAAGFGLSAADVVAFIGPSRPNDILERVAAGGFDLIHFSGHGFFDKSHPERSGLILSRDRVLSIPQLLRESRVPLLVFVNACQPLAAHSDSRKPGKYVDPWLPRLAEALFNQGVHNVVGSAWPVDADAALKFASSFYAQLLAGRTVGDSVVAARNEILVRGAAWCAFQHYGRTRARIVSSAEDLG